MRSLPPSCVVLLMLASPLAWAGGAAETTLCGAGEAVVFSCHVGKKIVSLCHPANAAHSLSYRFGPPAHAELVYPDAQKQETAQFSSVELPEYGGASQTVTFKRGAYRYDVYSAAGRSEGGSDGDRTPESEDGLIVWRGDKQLKKMVCDDGGEGFRENIDWIKAK